MRYELSFFYLDDLFYFDVSDLLPADKHVIIEKRKHYLRSTNRKFSSMGATFFPLHAERVPIVYRILTGPAPDIQYTANKL